MIIEVTREPGENWSVMPRNDDGTPLRNRQGIEHTSTRTPSSDMAWGRVGELVSAAGSDHTVSVRYRDEDNMRARVERGREAQTWADDMIRGMRDA